MSTFYTYVGMRGNNILYRGVNNGREVISKIPFSPTLFIKSKSGKGEWSSIYEEPLEPVTFGDIKDAKEFCAKYEDVHGFEIHGMQQYQYQYIAQEYPGAIQYDLDLMNISTIDIETKVVDSQGNQGFPDIEKADNEILLITLFHKKTKKAVTFGTQSWDRERCSDRTKALLKNVEVDYRCFTNEQAMLRAFVEFWAGNYPHLVTGWNSEGFDFPYLCNRINRVLGSDAVRRLSPFGVVMEKTVEIYGKKTQLIDIIGVVDADLLHLYKKYTYGNQESYSLDYISTQELGTGKLSYDCTFREFYENQWDDFVGYNIIDCLRVDQIDDKMQLIDLLLSISYLAKCNVKDTFGTVRPWDIFIYNHLNGKKIAVPPASRSEGGEFAGGWVKEPQLGMHGWTLSFDFSSLYPTIMRQWNISPDTYVKLFRESLTVKDLLNDQPEYFSEYAHFNNWAVAANGTCYRRDKMGFIPEIIAGTMAGRKVAKKEMLRLEQEYGQTKDASLKPKIAALNNRQMAFKILNNSLYGAISNVGFRYYQIAMAEAITLTGQASDQHIEMSLNRYMNKVLKTKDVDYVIAGDTDSVYLNLDPVVKKHYPNQSIDDTVKWIDKFVTKGIQPIIDESIERIFKACHCFEKLMDMKREAIASKALWQRKKRYGMIVHNSEGVDYKPFKLKIMGLDIIKSSTPGVIRDDMKECLKIMFEHGEAALQAKVLEVKEKFYQTEPELIAFPRGVSDISAWQSGSTYKSGCPIHVRAAILFNEYKGSDEIAPLRNGDKIKFIYLKTPNPIKENVIGFPADGVMPRREALRKYVDYDTQWEKTFVTTIKGLADVCGWNIEETVTLDC